MIQMKKKMLGLLSATLLAGTLTGCSVGSTPPSTVNPGSEVSKLSSPSDKGSNDNATKNDAIKPESGASLLIWEDPSEVPFVKELAAAFKQQYNVDVKVEAVPAPDQAARLANDGPAGLGADVVMFPHDKLGNAVTAGLLLPNDVFEKNTITTMAKAAIDAATYEGKLYGYPKSVETYALLYNKDIIKEQPKTWEDIIAFSKTYNDKAKKKYGIMWETKIFYYNYLFIASYGGYIFGKNGTDPNDIGLNSANAVEGLKFYQSMRDILPIKVEDMSYDVKTQLFQEGKLAYNIDGPWSIGTFKNKVNFGVMPLPDLPGGKKSISFSGVRSYYVNSYTKFPMAAKLFAQFATNKDNALLNFKSTGILPANADASKDPLIANDPLLGGFVKQFTQSQVMPTIPQTANIWTPMEGALTAIWNDNADVNKKLDEAVKTIKDQLASSTGKK
jgi:arabinogalactan oligomer/maltooligosaccharide transport system substrate-binding protein